MVDGGMDNGRVSGTGQDTPTVYVHVPHRFPMPLAGHSVTMSRPVPLSRIGGSVTGGALRAGLLSRWYCEHRPQDHEKARR
jgi:hypothetical protein